MQADDLAPLLAPDETFDQQWALTLLELTVTRLRAEFTAAGKPFTQGLAYSNDRGRTWTKYAGNPVLPHVIGENRDPKVVWHAPTRRWIMALFKDGHTYALFSSPDLKSWKHLQDLEFPDCGECPDFFEMPVDGNRQHTRWVFTAANGHYFVGGFDGTKFTPDGPPQVADWGKNYYAVQTYSDMPARDGRRIQIAWMRDGRYPGIVIIAVDNGLDKAEGSVAREVAIRGALGATRSQIRTLFLLESGCIGLAGSLAGAAVGAGLSGLAGFAGLAGATAGRAAN